jgi:hypothetical protein
LRNPEPEPSLAVDQPDQTLQLGRVLDRVSRFEKNRAEDAGMARQLIEDRE